MARKPKTIPRDDQWCVEARLPRVDAGYHWRFGIPNHVQFGDPLDTCAWHTTTKEQADSKAERLKTYGAVDVSVTENPTPSPQGI